MVTDAYGEAGYRVTATEAQDVDYQIDYTFRQRPGRLGARVL